MHWCCTKAIKSLHPLQLPRKQTLISLICIHVYCFQLGANQLPFFIMILVCVALALTGYGEIVPFLFAGYLILFMVFSALRDQEGGSFIKIFILPIVLLCIIGFAASQCSDGQFSQSRNLGGSSWKSNSCGKGAWFDEFSDGRGRWRNLDGKFCSR